MGLITIIWKGKGYLVFLITFALLVVTEYMVEKFYNNEEYYQTEWWPIAVGMSISGIFTHFLNIKLNGAHYLDEPSRKNHSLFFIDLKYWTLLLPILGLLLGVFYMGPDV